MNLPLEIITIILSRLPIRTIISCKCVCKQWLELLSSPEFAKFHISISTPGLVVHQFQYDYEDLCKIFEFEDVVELQHHNLHYIQVMKFEARAFISSPDGQTTMNGSVDGLLLLHDFNNQPEYLYICNPITREYISLPSYQSTVHNPYSNVKYGFGVSKISCEYKVVRIQSDECLIYTLGTGSWRRSIAPCILFKHCWSFGVFLNGNLHWLVGDSKGYNSIACFDLEIELFKPFCCPPPFQGLFPDSRGLVALEDCLCLCQCIEEDKIVIWVMKEYGVKESWTQQFVITLSRIYYRLSQVMYPIKIFKDGDILILLQDRELFYYCNKNKTTQKVDLFEMVHYIGWTEAMLHKSSFLSLKSFTMEDVCSF